MGILFAIRLLTAEYWYAWGEKNISLVGFEKSVNAYIYGHMFRLGLPLEFGNAALQHKELTEQALKVMDQALIYDPYAPDLLALAITLNLNTDNVTQAQKYYNTFKLVDRKSYLIRYIDGLKK